MGGVLGSRKAAPTDAKPPKAGEPAVAVPAGWCQLDLTGTPARGKRVADGPLGDESLATIGDFVWAEGPPKESVDELVDLLAADGRGVTPYTVDHLRRRVILVQADPSTLTEGTFVYQQQRQHATRVYAVPYAMLAEAVERLAIDAADGWSGKVIFLHSTGRCGSTLLCRLLGKARGVVSLSEPDVYSYITWLVSTKPNGLDELLDNKVLSAITWLLYRFACPGNSGVVCIKMRSQVIELAEVLKRAMPASKQLFLYRNPVDTIDSFCMAFLSNFVTRQLRWWNLDSWFIYKVSGWDRDFPYLAPLLAAGDRRFREDLIRRLGFVGLMTMIWLSNMDTALRLQRTSFFDGCIMYEDLCIHRVTVAKALIKACGYDWDGLEEAEAGSVFDEDAHGHSGETRSRRRERNASGPMYITKNDEPLLKQLLEQHVELTAASFVVPNTHTFEE